MKYAQKYGIPGNWTICCSDIVMSYIIKTIDRYTKGCILPFPKKGNLRLAKNYRGITLTAIAVKIYNALIRNLSEPKIEKILKKNQRKNRANTTLAYGLQKETVAAIMMLYRNTKVTVCSPDVDTDYFDIVAGILQGNTLAPYLFFIRLDDVLRTSSPGGNTPQDTNCTATCPLSRKLFKLDEPDMQDTAGEAGTNS